MIKLNNQLFTLHTLLFVTLITPQVTFGQAKTEDYMKFFNEKNFLKSVELIENRLKEFYNKRIEYRIVTSDFISARKTDSDIDLRKLFRNRKVENNFAEANNEIHTLHLYAGKSYSNLNKYNSSLSHYFQCLRFKLIEPNRDDPIFYEIAQVYKKAGNSPGYANSLETAYELNPRKPEYSLELGILLIKLNQKKKALYHLLRYISSTEDAIDSRLYLTIGNLSIENGKFLEGEKYYKKYLVEKPDDANILFALGSISMTKTGNIPLALELFTKSLTFLSDKDISKKSKAHEYIGDIAWNSLNFKQALISYGEALKYQEKMESEVKKFEKKLMDVDTKIKAIKYALVTKKNYDDFSAYETLIDDKSRAEQDLNIIKREYRKLNPGRVRWHIADSHERAENYSDAIEYYRQSISFNYQSDEARKKITKLQLKINRGY